MSTLAEASRKLLDISTAHLSQETCDAASEGKILWASTYSTEYGFLAYCHEERSEETHDDLWAVLQFACARGFNYVLFDRDAVILDQTETGLEVFDW